jgi:hypothetical protein
MGAFCGEHSCLDTGDCTRSYVQLRLYEDPQLLSLVKS